MENKHTLKKHYVSETEKDVESSIEFIRKYKEEKLKTKEGAITILKEIGILTKKGNISKHYKAIYVFK